MMNSRLAISRVAVRSAYLSRGITYSAGKASAVQVESTTRQAWTAPPFPQAGPGANGSGLHGVKAEAVPPVQPKSFVPLRPSRFSKPESKTQQAQQLQPSQQQHQPQQSGIAQLEKEVQPKRTFRKFKARKAALSLTPRAVERLKALMEGPNPKFIRVCVRNRGCSGLQYHLEYVDAPGKFDEEVVQDGVKVLIDSKALFSIIGSEMDFEDNPLFTKFTFKNPNIKGECGCGESFMV
ncbi:hypothetical protein CANCADRAFT_29994 [Tortispora caseinolytica NRRL Y-17796]|uniref:Iron-sulfur assembly protein 1 n=1 Tax=Tortispora caseinolytica NRRL Y-17796 TaxID=767744 RepID=A0A1E4TIM9_9ASCO|nr:hypothetical protein CANCADRAFT_29994 [Tortispora caseinolytica NRRL Y-17796]